MQPKTMAAPGAQAAETVDGRTAWVALGGEAKTRMASHGPPRISGDERFWRCEGEGAGGRDGASDECRATGCELPRVDTFQGVRMRKSV